MTPVGPILLALNNDTGRGGTKKGRSAWLTSTSVSCVSWMEVPIGSITSRTYLQSDGLVGIGAASTPRAGYYSAELIKNNLRISRFRIQVPKHPPPRWG